MSDETTTQAAEIKAKREGIFLSDWLLIDQERINAFADVTLDRDPAHIDPKAAADGPFGQPTAHGFLTLSLLPHLLHQSRIIEDHAEHINYGLDRVRWMAPVPVNSRIRARIKELNRTARSDGRHLIKHEVAVEVEGQEKPGMIAESIVAFRA